MSYLGSRLRLDGEEWKHDHSYPSNHRRIETNEQTNGNSLQIKPGMKEMCSTCDELRKVNDLLSTKCLIYEQQIESLGKIMGKINAECGSFLQESHQKIAKLNEVVALITQQIAENIKENTTLGLEIDKKQSGNVKENHCQLGGNNLPDINKFLEIIKMHIPSEDNLQNKKTNEEQDIERYSEMENSENSEDVQDEDDETEASLNEKQLQTCSWIVHDGKGTSGCCGKVFSSVGDLVLHINRYHLNVDRHGNYICLWDGCKRNGEPFKDKTALVDHFRTHSGERPYRCPFEGCGRAFKQRTALHMHRNTHSSVKFPCLDPECSKVFTQKSQMMLHYRARHTGERKGLACPVEDCGKVFDSRSALKAHSLTHTGERPHVCPYKCGRAYTKACLLKKHMIVHAKNEERYGRISIN